MTRTDLTIAAVTKEIEAQRAAIDADDSLSELHFTVLLRNSGVPEKTWTEKKTRGREVRSNA